MSYGSNEAVQADEVACDMANAPIVALIAAAKIVNKTPRDRAIDEACEEFKEDPESGDREYPQQAHAIAKDIRHDVEDRLI